MLVELRWVQIALSIIALGFWFVLALKHNHYWGYTVAPILFLLHIIIFNIARLYGFPAEASMATIWSVGIRVLGIIAAGILGGGLLLDLRHNGYNGYVK